MELAINENIAGKLVAITNVKMMQDFIKYRVIARGIRAEVKYVPSFKVGRWTAEYRINGILLAEERNLTDTMMQTNWLRRVKSDRVYVAHDGFAEYCHNSDWYIVPTDKKERMFRRIF